MYDPIICVLKERAPFDFEIQLFNQTGFLFKRKALTSDLTYDVNTDEGYLRWLDIDEHSHSIIEVFFGKRDASLSMKFAIM